MTDFYNWVPEISAVSTGVAVVGVVFLHFTYCINDIAVKAVEIITTIIPDFIRLNRKIEGRLGDSFESKIVSTVEV